MFLEITSIVELFYGPIKAVQNTIEIKSQMMNSLESEGWKNFYWTGDILNEAADMGTTLRQLRKSRT